jgi:hypothetical protein
VDGGNDVGGRGARRRRRRASGARRSDDRGCGGRHTDSLAFDDEIVDSSAAFDDADNDLIADAQAAKSGATVRPTTCLIRNPTVFRKVVRTSGQIVATPSGNLTIVCHGQVQTPSIVVGGAPSEAIVVKDGPCFFGKRQVARSQLVVTPSLNVTFVCHDKTA